MASTAAAAARLQPRLMVLALWLTTALLLALLHLAGTGRRWRAPGHGNGPDAGPPAETATATGAAAPPPPCASVGNSDAAEAWQAALARYGHLRDDKFTIALQTYRREAELAKTLRALVGTTRVPSLLEVVVVWNDVDAPPPPDSASALGVPVRYRRSQRNSLNAKLWPDPAFQTQAVLLSDDDVYYRPDDLEFVFQTWRRLARHRITGALARCATPQRDGAWAYDFCRDGGAYSMVLTNLAFVHVALLDYYSSSVAQRLRAYVDERFNCEDIALNFVASLLTGEGPLLVTGRERYVNMEPAVGISRRPRHMETRSRCLRDLADMLGCMPLVNETGHVQRGVVVL